MAITNPTGKGGFKKGVSGNPGGRPIKDEKFLTMIGAAAPKCLENILRIADSPEHEDCYRANVWVCEQAHGKALQRNEHSSSDGGPLVAIIRDA